MRRQVLSLLVENNPGVTSHISGLFSRRGYNIDSFSSGVTADPRYTRITIVASGDEQILEQIEKQLAKLEDVVDIKKLGTGLVRNERADHGKDTCQRYRTSADLKCNRDFPWKSCRCDPRFHGDRTDRASGQAGCIFRSSVQGYEILELGENGTDRTCPEALPMSLC